MSSSTWQLAARLALQAKGEQCARAVEDEVTALFVELRTPLLRYLHSLGLAAADGEDVVQETFLSLFHHLRAGKPRDHLRGWVFRVGRNLALKRMAGNVRSPLVGAGEFEGLDLADGGPNPEELALWRRKHARLLAVVDALPERDRGCLLLRAEGLRYREIAEAMEMSLGSVAASLGRSLSKLSIADQE